MIQVAWNDRMDATKVVGVAPWKGAAGTEPKIKGKAFSWSIDLLEEEGGIPADCHPFLAALIRKSMEFKEWQKSRGGMA